MSGHKLTVKYVKTRDQFEGTCECGRWESFAATEKPVKANHRVHVNNRRNS